MDDPIKVIWKYKNNNRRIQYNVFIFVGKLSKDLNNIFVKIKDLNLYDTFIKLDLLEYKKLEKKYGNNWFEKFFNNYHIRFIIDQIKESNIMKKELIDKYGEEWYNNHINIYKSSQKKLLYSYEALIKDERDRKIVKKIRQLEFIDEDENVTYKMNKPVNIKDVMRKKIGRQKIKSFDIVSDSNLSIDTEDTEETESSDISILSDSRKNDINEYNVYSIPKKQFGGKIQKPIDTKDEDTKDEDTKDEDIDDEDYFETGLDVDDIIEGDDTEITEIEEIYKTIGEDVDANIIKTSNLIQKALKDDNIFSKKDKNMKELDSKKDNNEYDESLKNVYTKEFISTFYIYKDDTIKQVKNKICCSIKNNKKFGKKSYIIPSRQYLWSEYIYDSKIKNIMIGQKWLRRTEILDIDVEPHNNLRYYEELSGKLSLLKDNLRRYGNKIRREDDENNIIYDYEDYMIHNEIFMIDIYNELGLNYSGKNKIIKNLQDVYFKLYFPKIRLDEIAHIIEYLNNNKKDEELKINNIFDTILNDLLIETEITNTVEEVKLKDKYNYIFKNNYITQSVTHINLRLLNNTKIDLFRIFNEFPTSEKYPFIQYQTAEDGIIKYYEKDINKLKDNKESIDILYKWFENTPYGIGFKVKIKDKTGTKYMAIGLNNKGRIEYKTQWKEIDKATIEDIVNTYNYVRDLIKLLNIHNNRVKIAIPENEEFKYAFINTIQKFVLPEKFIINHNILSNFSRFFYPYVSLVIDPRKRKAKDSIEDTKSKYGTYLRYRRVTKYENQSRIEQRIIYFMRNYEFTDKLLAIEISKQFNITEEKALDNIISIRTKIPNLKKSRKILKKLENIPKYKPPGINIDIQGKQADRYKIRISGARTKEQLDRIINFMNILLFLYIEVYLYKRPERQILKDKLNKLTNIAQRRNKVQDVVNYSKEIKYVKQMAQVDKQRLGFKPEKGQNQYTRACQNSGVNKKRRPRQYNNTSLNKLVKSGYIFNKKTKIYEKKVTINTKKGRQVIILKALKLPELDENGKSTGNYIYYTCDPKENREHMYIGFLTRSSNPYGHCMPCCFIIDQSISKNKEKKDFFYKCLENDLELKSDKESSDKKKILGDILYILQDTNKIQDGRMGFLPKYLDFFFNQMLNNKKTIKNHYLLKSDTGYYFKYGTKQDEYYFLNSISSCIDKSINTIIDIIINVIEKDNNEHIFISLNNGDIKTQFHTREKYIEYLKTSKYLDYNLLHNIISIPGVILPGGLNIVIFIKENIIINKSLEKQQIREDFYIDCQDIEEYLNIEDVNKNTIFLLQENKNYYPIILVIKKTSDNKDITLKKIFKYKNDKMNIVNHIKDFYEKNCYGSFIENIIKDKISITSKFAKYILNKLDKKYNIRYQVIDTRYKCKYLITYDGFIVPLKRSGTLYDIQILKTHSKYIKDLEPTVDFLTKLYKLTDKKIPVKPIGVYYDEEIDNKLIVNSIMTISKNTVPITKITMNKMDLEKNGLIYERKHLEDYIDNEIFKGESDIIIDNRITSVKNKQYFFELYQLFRLEFSEFINYNENSNLKLKIVKIIDNTKIDHLEKVIKLRKNIYKIIDNNLYNKYVKLISNNNIQIGGKHTLVNIISKINNIEKYNINNDRQICDINDTKETCNTNFHCKWMHSQCNMSITETMVIEFVNKISEELAANNLLAFEVLKVGNYFVSDIVSYNKFTEKDGQKILRSNSSIIKKKLEDLFGKDNIPIIGKRRISKKSKITYNDLNNLNLPLQIENTIFQKIIPNNLTIFRAYTNGYYWFKQTFNDIDTRNLCFFHPIQSDIANYFRSLVINWIKDNKNKIKNNINKFIRDKNYTDNNINDIIVKLITEYYNNTNCYIELYVLSKINKSIPIVIIDDNNKIIYIYNDGIVYDKYNNTLNNKDIINKYIKKKYSNITIRFENYIQNESPKNIYSIYYLDRSSS